jgi:hypothetical protein
MIPVTIATIIAVSTDAMILFHSKDDISALFDSSTFTICAGPEKIGFRA